MWKVMIVDDEKLICRLVKALVKWDELGMELAAMAGNAPEALELAEKCQPDILITDIRMPGMDGLELIREMKSAVRRLRSLLSAVMLILSMPKRYCTWGWKLYLKTDQSE